MTNKLHHTTRRGALHLAAAIAIAAAAPAAAEAHPQHWKDLLASYDAAVDAHGEALGLYDLAETSCGVGSDHPLMTKAEEAESVMGKQRIAAYLKLAEYPTAARSRERKVQRTIMRAEGPPSDYFMHTPAVCLREPSPEAKARHRARQIASLRDQVKELEAHGYSRPAAAVRELIQELEAA